MDFPKEAEALEQQVHSKNELIKTLIFNTKREAKRFLTLLAKYNTQRTSEGVFAKLGKDATFEDI